MDKRNPSAAAFLPFAQLFQRSLTVFSASLVGMELKNPPMPYFWPDKN